MGGKSPFGCQVGLRKYKDFLVEYIPMVVVVVVGDTS